LELARVRALESELAPEQVLELAQEWELGPV